MIITEMSYMYRDGDNYKFTQSVLVAGTLVLEDIKPYLDSTNEEGFIPDDVGIPSAHPVGQYEYHEESDHPWHEIDEANFETQTRDDEVLMSSEELIEAFKQASAKGWPGQHTFEGW